MALYLVYFIKLSQENLEDSEMPDVYSLAANVLQEIKTKLPASSNFHESTVTNTNNPEISTASKSVQEFKKHNAYKNHKGYTFSEVFHNGVKDGSSTPASKNNEVIPESRFLYHSLENPLFKSNSLNLQSEDDNEPIISDVHKISSPFESKWIFFPTNTGLSGRGLGSSTFDFLKKSRGIRNPPDLSPFPSSFKLSNNSLFGGSKLELKPFGSLAGTSAPAQAVDSTSTENSFYGYNLKEVKTADGKTQGVMQIFDKDGLKKNVVYNEKGVVDQTVKANATKAANSANTNKPATKAPQKSTTPPKVQPTSKPSNTAASSKTQQNSTAIAAAKQNATSSSVPTTAEPSYWNQHFTNFTNYALPSEEVEYNQPHTNSFATPEYILFNFLGQLSSVPFIPSNENFVTNELNSFDETVDENAFFFVEK
ncbi:hypothetical protein V9T40_001170 [Parthenolecanium corni]|uniref:Uncharacterized protein n=1 Tax=Parthenolecanium corni TaxID=536013 RepID=A0AAN9Y155_9HEMI